MLAVNITSGRVNNNYLVAKKGKSVYRRVQKIMILKASLLRTFPSVSLALQNEWEAEGKFLSG